MDGNNKESAGIVTIASLSVHFYLFLQRHGIKTILSTEIRAAAFSTANSVDEIAAGADHGIGSAHQAGN